MNAELVEGGSIANHLGEHFTLRVFGIVAFKSLETSLLVIVELVVVWR